MSEIVILGSLNMDFVVRQACLPRPGETMFGTSFSTVPGGKGLNQAVAAARAGARVSFIGAVGRDTFGATLKACLEEEGVDVENVATVDAATGTAHVSVLDGGENVIVVVPGANHAVASLDEEAKQLIRGASMLVAQLERPLPLVLEAFHLAREAGVCTVLTPAPARDVDDELLALTEILIPNAQEARDLAALEDEEDAATSLSKLAKTVVMTRGARGALVASESHVTHTVAARSITAVDTTGAGDTFAGTLATLILEGADLQDALETATVAASLSATRIGASTSMPRRDETDEATRRYRMLVNR